MHNKEVTHKVKTELIKHPNECQHQIFFLLSVEKNCFIKPQSRRKRGDFKYSN